MDQGVIRSLQSSYQKCVMHILECLDKNKVCSKNVLNTTHFFNKAWRQITEKTIRIAFQQISFAPAEENASEILEGKMKICHCQGRIVIKEDLTTCLFSENLDDFVTVDDTVISSELESDLKIVQEVQETQETMMMMKYHHLVSKTLSKQQDCHNVFFLIQAHRYIKFKYFKYKINNYKFK